MSFTEILSKRENFIQELRDSWKSHQLFKASDSSTTLRVDYLASAVLEDNKTTTVLKPIR